MRHNLASFVEVAALTGCIVGAASGSAVAQCPPVFAPAVTYGVGSEPTGVSMADFNGDGRLDLAVVNRVAANISILLGNGDGTFQSAVPYPVGGGALFIAVGDFNRDSKLDLAVATTGGTGSNGNIAILLGNGNGSFQTPASFAAGLHPFGIAAADVDGDGVLDLIAVRPSQNEFGVHRGIGNGSFTTQTSQSYTAGNPQLVRVADFNQDGKVDMAVPAFNDNSVSVFLGTGNAASQLTAVNYAVGSGPLDIGVADFNNDGRLDLAVANQNSSNVSVLLGNSNGTFQAAVNYSTVSGPGAVTVGDVNGDGRPDIIVSNDVGNLVTVLLGNGNGSFQAATQYPTGGGSPRGVVVGDFNGDGRLDIAVANLSSNTIGILRQVPSLDPLITQKPMPMAVLPATTATFSVAATSAAPLTYQWRRNGSNLSNAPTGTGSVITGVETPTLTISYASYADNGSAFDCIVSNACGSKLSDPAGLAVGPHCRADYSANGTIEVADIFAFLNAWFAGCP